LQKEIVVKTLISIALYLTLMALPVQLHADGLAGDVHHAITAFKKKDSGMKKFFDSAWGYVVFPNVGKGGFIIGGAHGNGLVYEKGKLVGHASLTQGTIGFQAGGQEFSEVIFFENQKAMSEFKKSRFAMSAEVSAVIAADGAAGKAKYHEDVAVFLLPKGGLMFEASVGGQRFDYKPGVSD
jgi:lipid-binding SYLF domain-containing protein